MSLAMARQRAAGNRTAVAEGRDPLLERRKTRKVPTFREVGESYLKANAPRWKAQEDRKKLATADGKIRLSGVWEYQH